MLSTLALLEQLRKKNLFTLNQLALLTRMKKSYTKIIAHRLKRKGILYHLEKGKYTAHNNPLLFATHLVTPSYFTLWTALSFYGLTTQLPRDIFVGYMRPKPPILFLDISIRFFRTDPWGFHKEKYDGMDIFIADKEKLFIDILSTTEVPFSEMEELLEEISPEKAIAYALKTKNKSLMKRAGFLLEERDYSAEKLYQEIDYNDVLLVKGRKRKGKRNKKWRIIDNR